MSSMISSLSHYYLIQILRVPFLDPLSCMLDDTLPLTQHEKEEWGDITRDPDAMAAMKSYAPYHNIIGR